MCNPTSDPGPPQVNVEQISSQIEWNGIWAQTSSGQGSYSTWTWNGVEFKSKLHKTTDDAAGTARLHIKVEEGGARRKSRAH